jgi:sugar O-acyltransferase (sialic acid O-acetyltransferase NeuD family)
MFGAPDSRVIGIVADDDIDMSRFEDRGITQLGSIDDLKHLDATHFIAAVGYPAGRKAVAERAIGFGLQPISIIHPRAWVPNDVPVGPGSVILAGVCISPRAVVGCHVYLSHGSLIGHDCRASDYASVMPGAAVSGDTLLGEGCTIGANATVLEKRSVGAWAVIGAGAVVTSDIPDNVTAKGIPARYI